MHFLVSDGGGHNVTTIEGLAADGAPLHPMQEAFRSIMACNADSARPA